jgi:hypothetical protein
LTFLALFFASRDLGAEITGLGKGKVGRQVKNILKQHKIHVIKIMFTDIRTLVVYYRNISIIFYIAVIGLKILLL